MRTSFTDLVGCRLPIQQAGFDSMNVDLAAAVSEAGGLGMLGAPLVTADALAGAFDRVREKTGAPVAANFAWPFFDIDRDAGVLDVATQRAVMVEFFYGEPNRDVIERIHAGGCLASWQVGSRVEALQAVEYGCDIVVVQGTEAGGHVRGRSGLLPLLCEVLDRVEVPVIAAGGLTTARALSAVLAAGASGGRLGTALVASEEADFHIDFKRAVVGASGEDTVYSEVFSAMWPDAPHRVLRSAVETVERLDATTVGAMEFGGNKIDLPRMAGFAPHADATGRIDAMALFAGEGVGAITAIRPAGEIVRDLVNGASELLRSAAEREST
jgi:NAD(P)H-dependent flavin oxidoreductase YrpB (nitropropane dioxygenase family)